MERSMTSPPFVSVLMPVRNEEHFIAGAMSAVLLQDYPRDRMEVLVIDGMSTDGTRKEIQRVQSAFDGRMVTILDNPAGIVPTALNIGLRHARGEIIVRVDGHCEIEPDYVRQCVEILSARAADCVGGLQRAVGKTLVAQAIAVATSSRFGVGSARFHYATEAGWADTVYLGAYRRDVFDRVGLFDEELVRNQDDEFNFRLSQAGGRIWLDPRIRCRYFSRASFSSLWRQYFQYGIYKIRVAQKRAGLSSWRHVVPASFVIALALGVVASAATGRWAWLGVILLPYLAVSLATAVYLSRRQWQFLVMLPAAFATLHLSYGLGFLWGVWRWRRWFGATPPAPIRDR
jgi:glycosyltransferase involved in cell wall biosynthesis